MSTTTDTLTRVIARYGGRALPTRATSALGADPLGTIGIATIKIVTEEQIQGIAYGPIDAPPQVIARLDPIGRDVADLLPFARFLDAVAQCAIARDGELRIWVPHAETIAAALDVLGHRYWRNQSAPAEVMRMGEICRILAHESGFEGQQVVADDAAQVLRTHAITGQSPIEDGNLDAMLAWFEADVTDPLSEARRRSRFPASGILINTPDRRDDERVDRLRKDAKRLSGTRLRTAQMTIQRIVSDSVVREWNLMTRARDAFWRMGLLGTGLEALIERSRERVAYALANGYFPARRADRISIELDEMDSGRRMMEQSALEADPSVRAQARRAGGAIAGNIVQRDQPRHGRHPCSIHIETPQSIVRTRHDDKVMILGSNVTGVVREIGVSPSGGTRLRIEVFNGVRSTSVLAVGSAVEIIEQGNGYRRTREFSEAAIRDTWMFFRDAAPALAATDRPGWSASKIAGRSRRS